MRNTTLSVLFISSCVPVLGLGLAVNTVPNRCFQPNGAVYLSISNGSPPFTISGNFGPTLTVQGTYVPFPGLLAGTYAFNVTDGTGATANTEAVVGEVGINVTGMIMDRTDCDLACSGVGRLMPYEFGGIEPYTYSHQTGSDPVFTDMVRILGLCSPQTTVTITDANGCTGSITVNVASSFSGSHEATNIVPACGEEANGSFNLVWLNPPQWSFRIEGPGTDTIYYDLPQPFLFDSLGVGTYAVTTWVTDDIRFCDDPAGCQRYCTDPSIVTIPSAEEPCGSPTEIPDPEDLVPIRVFPQPSKDLLFITGVDPAVPFDIVGMDGRTIAVPSTSAPDGLRLDVTQLATGIYLLRLPDRTIRIVKN